MNNHLSSLLNGYQDLVDRYGEGDPLVLRMKDEIEQRKAAPEPVLRVERRRASVRSGIWNRQPQRVDKRP